MILLGGQSSGTRDTRTGANVLMHLTLPARASLLREEVEPAAEQLARRFVEAEVEGVAMLEREHEPRRVERFCSQVGGLGPLGRLGVLASAVRFRRRHAGADAESIAVTQQHR